MALQMDLELTNTLLWTLVALAAAAGVATAARWRTERRLLSRIPGPPEQSFLTGAMGGC